MKKITLSFLFGLISFFGFSQIYISENFDDALLLPPEWSETGSYSISFVGNCNGRSVRANLDSATTTNSLTRDNVAGQSDGTNLTISFDYKIVDWAAGIDATLPGWGNLQVQYSTNNGGIWTTAGTVDDLNHITSNVCAPMSFIVPAANLPAGSDFRLRFVGNWTAGTYYIFIDNIIAQQNPVNPPACVSLTSPADLATEVDVNDDNLTWPAATGSPTGYIVSVGTTSGGTDIVNNEDTGLSTAYDLPTLSYETTYYVTITPYNAIGNAVGCAEESFTTGADPTVPVDCTSGVPININYCYDNNETTTYNFQSSDGSPLYIQFNSGQMEACCDIITIYDGVDNTGTILFNGNNGGDLTDVTAMTAGNSLFIKINSNGSVSCDTNGFVNMDFDVSCVDTTAPPNCTSLTTPTDGQTGVNENTVITWDPALFLVTGYKISIGTTAGGTDIVNNYDNFNNTTYIPAAPLTSGTTYYVTITPYNLNGNATGCTEESFTVRVIPDPPEGVTCTTGTSSFIFTEDFETDPAVGWTGTTFTGSNGDWRITAGASNTNNTGPFASFNGGMHLEYEASGNSTAIASAVSPPIDLTQAVDDAELSFYMHAFGENMGTLNVGVGTTAAGPFTNLFTWTGEFQTTDTEAWVPIGLDISAYLGQTIFIEFSHGGAGTGLNGDMAIDFVRVETCGPFCVAPSDLTVTGITDATADISWTANSGETAWEYVVQPAGTGVPTAPGTATSTNPVTATGLTAFTAYEVYVRADCGVNGQSDWAGPINFTTLRTPPPVPVGVTCADGSSSSFVFTEDFETNPAIGWTGTAFTGNNGDWDITGAPNSINTGPSASFSGGMHLEYEASASSTAIASAISPPIDLLPGIDGAELSFYMHAFGADMGTLNVGVGTTATGPFTSIFTWTGDYQLTDTEAWVPVGLDISAYLGQIIYVQFAYGGAGTGGLGDMSIDFVRVESCGPFCITPSNITVTGITGTTADVSWTSNSGEAAWEYVVQPAGTGEPTASGMAATATSVTATSLDFSTDYEVYIRADCGVDGQSLWAGPVNFSTSIQTNFSVDCALAEIVNTTYCYENNETITFLYTSTTGYPLNIAFNAGQMEACCDDITIYDGTDITGTVLFTGNNGGNLTGVNAQSTTDSLFIVLDSDFSVNCVNDGFVNMDWDVWCQTCITQTVDFAVNGDCNTDLSAPTFMVNVDISNLGDATSITVSDDQGGAPQVTMATGVVTMGPYPANTDVIITATNTDDSSCIVTSGIQTFRCPTPPNPCSVIFAGDDVNSCPDTATSLTATFQILGQDTNVYEINALDGCPLLPTVGGTPTSLDADDDWSDVIDMGFEFCFFGETYNQILVGSNGVLSFDLTNAGTDNEYQFSQPLPNNTNPTLAEANIFGVGHDIDPFVCGDINYVILGSAPSRQFVVNYSNICHYSFLCNDLMSSSQIILYESSNTIDINIFDKPTCTTWNGGNAVVGIQNPAGTVAFTPPGRNTGVWTPTDVEFWRFSPSQGTANYTFEWLEGTTSLGTTETITVNPTTTTTYTAAVTYTLCTGGTATITDDVEITVDNAPTAPVTTPVVYCVNDTATAITTSVTAVGALTWYSDATGATTITEPIINTSTASVTSYWVSQTDATSGCESALTEIVVTINALPTAPVTTPVVYCLNDTATPITTSVTAVGALTWYSDATGATTITEPIIDTSTAGVTSYWVSQTDATSGCESALTEIEVTINALPVLANMMDTLFACDDNIAIPAGQVEMDLTTMDASFDGGNAAYVVSYYNTLADAQAGTPQVLPSADAYIGTDGETIFVRVEDTTTGCYDAGATLLLRVVDAPVANVPPQLASCDSDNDHVTFFNLNDATASITVDPTLEVTYHLTQENAEDDILAIVEPQLSNYENNQDLTQPPTNLPYSQIIWVRVDYLGATTDCPTVLPLELLVNQTPDILTNLPTPYEVCDDDADGFVEFDLPTQDAQILNGLTPADYQVSYYTDVADADIGITAASYIASPATFTNTVINGQTLGVRVEDITGNNPGCYRTTTLEIVVNPLPVIAGRDLLLEICDNTAPEDSTADFNLTTMNSQITGSDASLTVDYYETDADVLSNTPIPDYTAYTVTANQTLQVIVTSGNGCTDSTTLTLRVLSNPTPTDVIPDRVLCDDAVADGITMFDLTDNGNGPGSQETFIINGETPVPTLAYYLDPTDADLGVVANAIPDPTIHENTASPGTQAIYVRVTNANVDTFGNNCYKVVSFNIVVDPLPDVTGLDVTDLKLIACELDGNDIEMFDLTQNTAVLNTWLTTNGQTPADYYISYHNTQADADAGISAIVNTTTYTNEVPGMPGVAENPQTIFVQITNGSAGGTGCTLPISLSFEIEVQDGAVANQTLADYVICDNVEALDDGVAQFNLTSTANNDGYDYNATHSLYADILDSNPLYPQTQPEFTITFYSSLAGAESGPGHADELPFTYENTINPQTIFVRIDNNTAATDVCYDISTLTLSVNPLPIFDLDASYVICANLNGSEVVTKIPTIDTGLDVADYTFVWSLNDTVQAQFDNMSSIEPTEAGTYTVLVTDRVTGCDNSASDPETFTTMVNESSPPLITAAVVTEAFAENHGIEVTAENQAVTNPVSEYEFSLNMGEWVLGTGTAGETYTHTFLDNVRMGVNKIRVRDVNGCGQAETELTVMDYPLLFTPNGDDVHETWNITPKSPLNYLATAKIYIFDRYGKLLKQLSPTGAGWDGTYNGEPLPPNDYWFTIEYIDPVDDAQKEFKAHFTLKR